MIQNETDQDFCQEIECVYKDERYSVRDNGAVLRHCQKEKRPRPTDNKWTFGKLNEKTGYLEIAAVRVHRIVATAFHGEPPTKEHVVDHIDTNKQNNRPDNLRWVTRLENVLLNPITAKRIALVCGSVEAFLEDPSKFRDKFKEPNYEWMCAVSAEEAQISKERLLAWANSDSRPNSGSLGEWLFNRTTYQYRPTVSMPEERGVMMSLTPGAAQRIIFLNDKPNEYPCTPQEIGREPLEDYAEKLKEGAVFFRNHNGSFLVVKSGFSKDRQSLYVMTKSAYVWIEQKDGEYIPIPITEISKEDYDDVIYAFTEVIYKNGLFIHRKVETTVLHPKEDLEELFAECTQG